MSQDTQDFTVADDEDFDAALAARLQPVLARVAEGAAQREHERTVATGPARWLAQAGFGALRVPRAQGGAGLTIAQWTQWLIALAEADSSLAQALRGHFAYVEDLLNAPDSPRRDAWLQRIAAGELVGNAWSEIGERKLGELNTFVTREADGHWRVDGRKFYSTGSLLADWIDVLARRSDGGGDVIAVVRTQQSGVAQSDDWDGFGQRTSGSGSVVFDGARAEAEDVTDFGARFKYQTAFYQLNLLAVLAGIGRALLRDTAEQVRQRTRVYSHGNAPHTRDDAQVLQLVGQISSRIYAAEATVLRVAAAVQRAFDLRGRGDAAERAANVQAEIESAQAQVAVAEWVIVAAGDLFNALGASAVRTGPQLDRHWRNARTVASHNPLIFKARIVGDWVVNGREPPFTWKVGVSPEARGGTAPLASETQETG